MVWQKLIKQKLALLFLAILILIALFLALRAFPLGSASKNSEGKAFYITATQFRVGHEAELSVRADLLSRPGKLAVKVLAPGDGAPKVKGRPEDFYGLAGVQLAWLPPEQRELEIRLAAAAGAKYIGLDFEWSRIERARGRFDWQETDEIVALAKKYGLKLLPMLMSTPRWASSAPYAVLDYRRSPPVDYNDYRRFVHQVVSRYKPHGISPLTADGYGITDWVIWNEPINCTSPKSWNAGLREYIRLLKAGYEGAHSADQRCNVLNGGLADIFWKRPECALDRAVALLYDPNGDGDLSEGAKSYFDTLNLHTYQLAPPTAEWYRGRIQGVLEVMNTYGDGDKKIWLTETGYGSAEVEDGAWREGPPFFPEALQASAVPLVYEACAQFEQVERVFWWSLRDYYVDYSPTNEAMEAHYGLLRANFAPKPAYLAYAQMAGKIGETFAFEQEIGGKGELRIKIPASFISKEGTYIVFAWLDDGLAEVAFISAS